MVFFAAIFCFQVSGIIDDMGEYVQITEQVRKDWKTTPFASIEVREAVDGKTCKDLLGEDGDDLFQIEWKGTIDGWHDGNIVYRGWLDDK